MNPELYDLWRECWQAEHPHQTPPTIEQVNRLMKMFQFTAAELFGFEEQESGDCRNDR